MSTNVFSSIAAQLDPTGVLGVAIDNPDVLRNSGNSIQLTVGQRTKFRATLGGVGYDAYATLRSARLHRLSLIDHYSNRKNSSSWLVTGIMKPVKMDIEIVIGGQLMTIQEFLYSLSQQSATKSTTLDEFSMTLENLGMKFDAGLPLFFQQFGSNKDEFDRLVEMFKAYGAKDAFHTIKDPKRIKEVYQMPNISQNASAPGPEILSFEVTKADRKQSQTYKPELGFYGQGFIDFADAIVSNYIRCVGLRNEADVLSRLNEEKALAENWSTERKDAEEKKVTAIRALATKWSSNWAGAQERILVNPKDSNDLRYATPREFDPTQLGSGKMTVVFNNEPQSFNLWTDNRTVADAAVSVADAPSAVVPDENETPVEWN